MITMVMLGMIRRMFYRDGLSRSEISRRTGLSRNTIKKWLRAILQMRIICICSRILLVFTGPKSITGVLMKAVRPVLLFALALGAGSVFAQEKVLNLYSARHYQTDEALYADFTKQTGIKINRIEGNEDELLERIKNEGANSPADVFFTVDAARLAQADALGLFAPVKSRLLEERIPDHLRAADWFAFSTRARVIIYNKAGVNPANLQTYEGLVHPSLKGKICVRAGSHPYNLSLGSALIHHLGEQKTEEWARGLVANFARAPKGGDTDQIKAVAAGECGVAISNTYYIVRLMRSAKAEDRKVVESIGIVWPNQKSFGTHINVSGGGVYVTVQIELQGDAG